MPKKISIIVPCYNEREVLPIFSKELKTVLDSLNYEYEVIYINDGSKDSTLDYLINMSKDDSRIKYISFSRNFGKEAAMLAGFCNAKGDYIAVMDADMQDPPALLPQMLKILEEDKYDSVATRRVTREGEPIIRSFFARQFYKVINKISDADIVDGARDFRLMKRDMVEAIISMKEINRFSKGIFGWVGYSTYWLPYKNQQRVAGETKWSLWKLFKYSIEGIVNFSQVPLSLASWFGIFMTLVSFVFIGYIVIRKLIYGNPVSGWASTMCVITMLGGIQLFSLGIMGQYIAKMYIEVKKRPHYIVEKTNIEGIEKHS